MALAIMKSCDPVKLAMMAPRGAHHLLPLLAITVYHGLPLLMPSQISYIWCKPVSQVLDVETLLSGHLNT